MSQSSKQPRKRLESSRSTVQCNTRISREAKKSFELELERRRQACADEQERAKITMGSLLREVLEAAPWCPARAKG